MQALLAVLLLASCARASEPLKNVTVSWLGNSFPGGEKRVQQDIHALAVAPDGTVYTNVEWEEGGRNVGAYKDGDVLGGAWHTHGWGYEGGRAIALNNRYLFIGQAVNNEGGGLKDPDTWPPKGKRWIGVSRRSRADITKPVSFPGAKGGKGDTLKGGFLVVAEIPESSHDQISGLAADARRLFVSDPSTSSIRAYDAEMMKPLDHWKVERPGPLALDSHGGLWVLQESQSGQPACASRYTREGKPQPRKIELPHDVVPSAMASDASGERLLIADQGPAQRIRVYSHLETTPMLESVIGRAGGILSAPPGRFDGLKLNHPSAVGGDAAGNLYIASDGQTGGGGTVLERYTSDGNVTWRLFGLEFVDMADVDPESDTDVYTKEEHFRIQPDRAPGNDWIYRGYTVDRFRFPDDPRLHLWSAGVWVRRLSGRRFLFVLDMNAQWLQVYRFGPESSGEIAIPSGLFAPRHIREGKPEGWPKNQPARGAWVWRDADGNGVLDKSEFKSNDGRDLPDAQGWWVDTTGSVWLVTETEGIIRLPIQGLDERGNPKWDFRSRQLFARPSGFERIKRLRYDPVTDTMYLGGTTKEHANQHWKPMGPVIARFDHWTRAKAEPRWTLVAPYARGSHGHESCEPMGFDVAGDYLFVPYTGASSELKFASGHVEVFRLSDGAAVGHMEPPREVGEIGLQDIRECLRAHRRKNGSYLVFLEEDAKSKVLMYRWNP
ncbi:MAG: hypothetical protein ACP5XB_14045 [Isosphaeraceae bacterium]